MIPLTRCSLLSLEDIDRQETSYCLRPPYDTGYELELKENIEKFGILQPPLVQHTDGRYIILSGRKRIKVAKALAWKEIPCLFIEEGVDLFQICETILVHAQIGSNLSPVEQAIFFKKIHEHFLEEQAHTLLPLLGIKPHPYKLQEFTTYLQLDKTAINALHNGRIQTKTGNKLSKLCGNDQQTVIRLIDHFKLGGSKQQKLVDYAIELVMRTKRPFKDFILHWQQEDTASDNRPQQASELLNRLEKLCFPNRNAAEKQFQQFLHSVQLPGNTNLQHTASFEDDRLTLSIVFKDQDMFLRQWENIKKSL